MLDFYLLAVERLRAIGYERYEISNFARAGRRSIHNLKYWSMQPYRGFGSDAHSFAGRRRWPMSALLPNTSPGWHEVSPLRARSRISTRAGFSRNAC